MKEPANRPIRSVCNVTSLAEKAQHCALRHLRSQAVVTMRHQSISPVALIAWSTVLCTRTDISSVSAGKPAPGKPHSSGPRQSAETARLRAKHLHCSSPITASSFTAMHNSRLLLPCLQAVDEVYEGTCGDALPFCVQCGQPGGTGAALCSLGQAVPDGCEVAANPGLMPAPGCLAGGIEYRNNDRITFFGDTCNGNSAFKGRQTICRDGEVCTALLLIKMPACRDVPVTAMRRLHPQPLPSLQ